MGKTASGSGGKQQDARLIPTPLFPDSPAEKIIDLAGMAAGIGIPVLGPILQGVLSGGVTTRRFERVEEAVKEVVQELATQHKQVNEEYVKSEEFEELLAQTLDKIARELDGEKREIYRNFLLRIITSPPQSYWSQRQLLRLAEELSPGHIRLLRAFLAQPDGGGMGARIRALAARTGTSPEVAMGLAEDLERTGLVTNTESLRIMVSNSEETKPFISALGHQLLRFIAA